TSSLDSNFTAERASRLDVYTACLSPSKVGVEDDPIPRLAGFESLERFVDAAHREMFGLRRNVVPRGKFEHHFHGYRRTDRRARNAPLSHDERDSTDRNRLGYEADEVQSAVGSKRGDERVPVERSIRRDHQQV